MGNLQHCDNCKFKSYPWDDEPNEECILCNINNSKWEAKEMKTKIEMCCGTCMYDSETDTGSPFKSPCRECYEANDENDKDTFYTFWKPKEGANFFNLKSVQNFIAKKKENDRTFIIKTCDEIVKRLLVYLEDDPEIKGYDYVMNATSPVNAVVNELGYRGFKVKVSDPIKTYSSEEKRGDDNVVLTISGW